MKKMMNLSEATFYIDTNYDVEEITRCVKEVEHALHVLSGFEMITVETENEMMNVLRNHAIKRIYEVNKRNEALTRIVTSLVREKVCHTYVDVIKELGNGGCALNWQERKFVKELLESNGIF